MLQVATQLLVRLRLEEIERIELEGRPEQRAAIPQALLDGPLGSDLRKTHAEGTLWKHQSLALKRLGDGENVVAATGTASANRSSSNTERWR